jgi:hypothetical protein
LCRELRHIERHVPSLVCINLGVGHSPRAQGYPDSQNQVEAYQEDQKAKGGGQVGGLEEKAGRNLLGARDGRQIRIVQGISIRRTVHALRMCCEIGWISSQSVRKRMGGMVLEPARFEEIGHPIGPLILGSM